MSADNGFYVAQFPDGYRWCYCQAIENCDFFPEGSKERKAMLKDYFGQSPVFDTERDAAIAAVDAMQEDAADGGWTEYGLVLLSGKYEIWEETS